MKKKSVLILLMTGLFLTSCGSPEESTGITNQGSENSSAPESSIESSQPEEESTPESPEESASQNSEMVYSIGDTWTVDGQWTLTVESITETEDRNEYSEKNPAQVFIINYVYENIGYEDEYIDGLFFDLSNGQIIDSEGFMGYSYPGDVTDYPQETPVGAKCKAQTCIAVDNESSEIKLTISQYDGTGTDQTASFTLPVEVKNETEPEISSEAEPVASSKSLDDIEKYLLDQGVLSGERVQMGAELIGGIAGFKYKDSVGEIYEYDTDSEEYKKLANGEEIPLEGMEGFTMKALSLNGKFVLFGDDVPQNLIDAFNSFE